MVLNPAEHKNKCRAIQPVLFFMVGILLLPPILAARPAFRVESFKLNSDMSLYKAAVPRQDPGSKPLPREELAKGKFLVASRRLRDPNFYETVVLLIDYGQNGAMGLVINRPSEVKLGTVFPDIKGLKQRKDTLFVGGPVAVNQMLMLIRSPNPPEASTRVIEDVYMSTSWQAFERLIKNAAKDEHFRIFAGYAGWAPEQLDFERARGDWHVLKANADAVFAQNPSELWQEMIDRVAVKWVRYEKNRLHKPF